MKKPLLFYVIDEHTDDIKYCKKIGMKPYNVIDGNIKQYIYKGYVYDVLECYDSFSGFAVTLMRLPEMDFNQLLDTAVNSKKETEIVGSIGIMLKKHPKQFENFLNSLDSNKIKSLSFLERKNLKKLVKNVKCVFEFCCFVKQYEEVLDICERIKKDF